MVGIILLFCDIFNERMYHVCVRTHILLQVNRKNMPYQFTYECQYAYVIQKDTHAMRHAVVLSLPQENSNCLR